jgi:dolichol kinase
MGDTIWQLVIGVIIVAIIFTLVRPGSPSGSAITQISDALASLIGTATEYNVNSGGTTNG